MSRSITHADFANYIKSVKEGGSYILREDILDALTVKGNKVSGSTKEAIDKAWDVYQWIVKSRGES